MATSSLAAGPLAATRRCARAVWRWPALLALAGACAAPERLPEAAAGAGEELEGRLAALEQRLPDLLREAGVPGLSLVVVADGELVHAAGYGERIAGGSGAVGATTVFGAASLTKPVFAYAVMRLAEAGEIDLDRPLADYLAYAEIAHEPRAAAITGRMVLSHTTGLPNWRPRHWTDDPGPLVLEFEPGARWQYSGEGFVYLQRVVEAITGVPLAEHLRQSVFEPLGMTHSALVWEERLAADYAPPHRRDLTPRDDRKPDEANAAGSLQTTAADYGRFLLAVLDGRGLSAETRAAILTPQVEIRPGLHWGLGWGLERGDAGEAIWQWGHDPGNRAFAIAVPERRLGMAFFTNSDNGMLLLETLVRGTVGGEEHPALVHLDYEDLASPARRARIELARAVERGGGEELRDRYAELRGELPPEAFAESMLNRLGYDLLGRERIAEAIAVFELNVETYPEASNPHDSLGEAYMAAGRDAEAIASYERSLELDPGNDNAVEMLQRLRSAP